MLLWLVPSPGPKPRASVARPIPGPGAHMLLWLIPSPGPEPRASLAGPGPEPLRPHWLIPSPGLEPLRPIDLARSYGLTALADPIPGPRAAAATSTHPASCGPGRVG